MANPKLPERVLVYLQHVAKNIVERAQFKECILDYLGVSGLESLVSCTLVDNRLILSKDDSPTDNVLLKHPSFCPCHHLSPSDTSNIPEDTLGRGIDCGVATLLWSSDNYLLLTRRASHLRIFPGLWVPAGGHIERGETLCEAGLRELHEESGLKVDSEKCLPNLVALWESVYPPMLSRGLPRRHHVVVYQSVTSSKDHQQLGRELCLDPGEVGAAAWLEESMVRAMCSLYSSAEGRSETDRRKDIPEFIRASIVDRETGQTTQQDMSTAVFSERAPSDGEDVERLSTGTLFAMKQWCLKNPVR